MLGKVREAQAPRIAEPSNTVSDVSGSMIGRPAHRKIRRFDIKQGNANDIKKREM